MTVAELIEHLQQFPAGAKVLIADDEQDCTPLYKHEVFFVTERNAVVIHDYNGF